MSTVASFRAPTDDERWSADFLRLLESASGRTGAALRSLGARSSGLTTVIALIDDRLVGLAMYHEDRPTVLRYLAVDRSHRGAGLGRQLVARVLDKALGADLVAETDDDAVGFYRSIGFTVTTLPPDPQWPDVRRHRCTRAAPPLP